MGDVRTYEVAGRGITVAWTDEECVAVDDDECTHRQCSLGQGGLVGVALTCPCRLGMYDVGTGDVLDGPPPEPPRSYPVDVSACEMQVGLPME